MTGKKDKTKVPSLYLSFKKLHEKKSKSIIRIDQFKKQKKKFVTGTKEIFFSFNFLLPFFSGYKNFPHLKCTLSSADDPSCLMGP